MRTRECDRAVRTARMRKASRFFDDASLLQELSDDPSNADGYVSLLVLAGIAAADVICCARLGEFAQGENHADAIGLLERADSGSGTHLHDLLGMKSKAGYSALSPSADDGKRAGRAAEALVERARLLHQAE